MPDKTKYFIFRQICRKGRHGLLPGFVSFCLSCNALQAQEALDAKPSIIKATIVHPVGIAKTVDMNFGNIAVGNYSGKIILNPAGRRAISGSITLPLKSGTVTAASFEIKGGVAETYTISLPSEAFIFKSQSGQGTMKVNNFTTSPSAADTLVAGTRKLNVGATLVVADIRHSEKLLGEASFDVTVNYN
ncbi:MAG: DUF4402 domain-containing protein [Syntrophomonadaceae bacterium]